MARHRRTSGFAAATLVALAVVSSCSLGDQSAPALVGPSELGLSLTLAAAPDVLNLDGASQALVTAVARDGSGQPVANITLRVDTAIPDSGAIDGWRIQSVGALSANTVVTGSDGHASVTYTAPSTTDPVDNGSYVYIVVRPIGNNYDNTWIRTISIRLVPTGVILPPNGTPEAAFTTSQPLREDEPVTFDASASTDDGTIVTYAWNFGDGTTGSGVQATHTYSQPGAYTVTLTVTDDRGLSASTSETLTVGTVAGPTAKFNYSPASPKVSEKVYFNASESTAAAGRTIAGYSWEYGDGSGGSGQYPSHAYTAAGSYKVTLIVTDSAGKTGTTATDVTIGSDAPTASFTISPTEGTAGVTTIYVNASASTASAGRTIVEYAWDFGDGNTATSATPTGSSNVYAAAGSYTLTLTVTDDAGNKANTTGTITIS